MSKIPLAEFLAAKGNSQSSLAAVVDVTQGAISKMLREGRNVFVVTNKAGKATKLIEEKHIAPTKAA